jgi:hypothetical protein
MHNTAIKATGNKPLRFLLRPVAPRLISVVRREQGEKTVPAERSALSFAERAWPGA